MTRVTVLADVPEASEATYRAVGGKTQASGRTAGEVLDALTARLPEDIGGTMIIVRDLRPDRFFTAEQRRRPKELMDRRRALRDSGNDLPAEESDELEKLADAEVEATAHRAGET